jgi:hypothetical protein
MKDFAINDNIYPVGTTIRAKSDPVKELVIESYNQRIYYCIPKGSTGVRPAAFYEKELIAPSKS